MRFVVQSLSLVRLFATPMDCSTGFPGDSSGKESSCQCKVKIRDNKRNKRCGFDPWGGKIPWRRAWQTTPVLLLGESHGQRSLEGSGPWSYKRVGHDWCDLACTHGLQHPRLPCPSMSPGVCLNSYPLSWWGHSTISSFGLQKFVSSVTICWKLRKSYDKPRQCIEKQRHLFADKGLYSQSYGFSSNCVEMWELDHKEGWAPKNRCFRTVVLE